MKAKLNTLLSIAALSGGAAHAAVLFNTGFNTTGTTSAADNIGYAISNVAQASQTVALSGGGSNNPSPAGFWTVADTAKVDLAGIAKVSDGTYTWGHASTANDQIKKGAFWVTSTTFSVLGSAGPTYIRAAGATNNWVSLQANASADNNIVFNLIFSIATGNTYDNLSAAFTTGTAGTNGVWTTNTALQNGNFNVRLNTLDSNGLITSGFDFYNSAQAIGAGAGVAVSAVNQGSQSLGPGTYLLQISLTGKTQTQRYTMDNFSFSGVTVVPEPRAALLGGLGLLALLRRRRA